MDLAIRATSNDAIRTKVAAVKAGYYEDPFVEAFPNPYSHHVQPIIKRGTHARVACMDRAIRAFLDAHDNPQIVVLGAGKDTTFYRLQAGILLGGEPTDRHRRVRWFDVDQAEIVVEKSMMITKNPVFRSRISQSLHQAIIFIEHDWSESSSLSLVAHDLRDDHCQLLRLLSAAGFTQEQPTLFIMECVQMYLPEASSRVLLKGLVEIAPNSCLALYEPILGNDSFGRVMESNLMTAGVVDEETCLAKTRTLKQLTVKLSEAGFVRWTGCDMWSAYETVVSPEIRAKANACEFLDELEEWILIMRHYCLLVAATGEATGGAKFCDVGATSSIGFLPGRCESNQPDL